MTTNEITPEEYRTFAKVMRLLPAGPMGEGDFKPDDFEAEADRLEAAAARDTEAEELAERWWSCLLYTSPSPRDGLLSRMPSSA